MRRGILNEFSEYVYEVRIVRNPGKYDEKIQDNVEAAVQGNTILFQPEEDIEEGDYIYVTDPKISSSYKEPLVITDYKVFNDPHMGNKKATVMPLSKWKRQQEESIRATQQINVGGNLGTLAGRDITENINNYNINATILLGALEKAIEESQDIPPEEKRSLLEKVHGLANNDYVKGIGVHR
ncbi:MAG TPA: hypothetical protein HA349_00570 [Methanotrichaceae archaeon]|nr:hypothetical protein [Methanotrichaceae archaeon]